METPSLASAATHRGSPSLWYALFGGAAAWFGGLCAAYFLVMPSCLAGTELYVHLISATTFAAGAGAAVVGAMLWRASEPRWPDDGGRREDRTRFLAALGTVLSTLFTLVIFAQWLGAVLHGPCEPLPRLRNSPDAYVQPLSAPRWSAASPQAPRDLRPPPAPAVIPSAARDLQLGGRHSAGTADPSLRLG